ncbi:MAG: HisA/HisF-related TIM barrel protein, partial [Patescibacteria group bacterium]
KDLMTMRLASNVEAHLMVQSPEEVVGEWFAVADRVLVHVEATSHLDEVLDFFDGRVVEPGLVFNLTTPLEQFEKLLERVRTVQLMAINEIGAQGHPFNEQVFEKIKVLRTIAPNVKIQVDGGVTFDNAEQLIDSGADRLVVGSAIWRADDPLVALKKFQSYASTRGQA